MAPLSCGDPAACIIWKIWLQESPPVIGMTKPIGVNQSEKKSGDAVKVTV